MKREKPTILITGVSGMLGTAIAKRLVDRYNIVGFDIEKGDDLPSDVEFVYVDLTADESVRLGMTHVRDHHGDDIASVIHLAAYYDFSGEASPMYEELTVKGTGRLIQQLKKCHVGQFIFSSTLLVHAPCDLGERIDENSPLQPKWEYPQSKVETEKLIQNARSDIPAVILRIAGVYDDECHSLPIAHQIQRIYEKRMTSYVYPGDLDRGQAFIHLKDLLDAIERTVERREQLPEEITFLLGEHKTPSYGELQKELGRLIHDEEWDTQRIPKTVAKAGAWVQDNVPFLEESFIKPWMVDMADDHFAIDIGNAYQHIGWEPKHSLMETLPTMIEKLHEGPAGWYRENKLPLSSELKKEEAAKS